MDNVYHPIEFSCFYRNDYTDRIEEAFFMQQVLVSHDELMALIRGGRKSIRYWIANHSYYTYDEIIESSIDFHYNTKRRYDKKGKALDGGANFKQRNGYDILTSK